MKKPLQRCAVVFSFGLLLSNRCGGSRAVPCYRAAERFSYKTYRHVSAAVFDKRGRIQRYALTVYGCSRCTDRDPDLGVRRLYGCRRSCAVPCDFSAERFRYVTNRQHSAIVANDRRNVHGLLSAVDHVGGLAERHFQLNTGYSCANRCRNDLRRFTDLFLTVAVCTVIVGRILPDILILVGAALHTCEIVKYLAIGAAVDRITGCRVRCKRQLDRGIGGNRWIVATPSASPSFANSTLVIAGTAVCRLSFAPMRSTP